MKLKILIIVLLYVLSLPALQAELLIGGGAGLHYLPEKGQLLPEISLKSQGDYYNRISETFTFFLENRLYSVFTWQAPDPLYTVISLTPDLSYMRGSFLGRWGLDAKLNFTTTPGSLCYETGSWLMLSLGDDNLTFKILPGATYYSEGRVWIRIEAKCNLSFTLLDQIIITPSLGGELCGLREETAEGAGRLEVEIDWYPGLPLSLNILLGYEKYISNNSSILTYNDLSLKIEDYYNFSNLYGTLESFWLAGAKTNINLKIFLAYKLKEHGTVQFPVLGPQVEWQFTLAPELQLEFALTEKLTFALSANLYQIFSNTSYESFSDAGGGLELHYTF